MTAELKQLDEDDAALIDELPDPYKDSAYVKVNKKLQKMEKDLLSLDEEISAKKQELSETAVDDVESAEIAADLELEIEVANRQLDKLRQTIAVQRTAVNDAMQSAKMAYQTEARELWRDEFVPQIVEIYDRLMELRNVYKYLKQRCLHGLNPTFPSGFDRAIGKNELWLKKRKAEWLADE